MTIVEKAAYLKGLAEGLGIGSDTREGKLWGALSELLADMAHEIEDLQATHLDLADVVDDMCDDLSQLEDYAYGLDKPEEFLSDDEDTDDSSEETESEDETEDPDYEEILYDVTCPVCGEEITLDEAMLELGSIDCPNCGETLEFDLQDQD